MEENKNDNSKLKEAGIVTVAGAAIGAGTFATIGGAGLAIGGTAIGIGLAPFILFGALVTWAGYGIKKSFDKK